MAPARSAAHLARARPAATRSLLPPPMGWCRMLQNFTLNVTCPAITVAPAAGALAEGLYGTAYSQAFTPSGGVGPFTFDIATGSVPGGLTFSAAGTLAGTPTGATGTGNFAFTVRATDAFGCQGSTDYALRCGRARRTKASAAAWATLSMWLAPARRLHRRCSPTASMACYPTMPAPAR